MAEAGFLMNAQKDIPNGIPTLDTQGLLQVNQLPNLSPGMVGAESAGSVLAHENKVNPHPQYAVTTHNHTALSIGAIALSEKGTANGVATLTSAGTIPENQLPPIAITNTFVVNTQAAMLLLTAEIGDVAVRTDLNATFILRSANATAISSWQQLPTPVDTVLSVNGKAGVVVLNAADVGAIAVGEKEVSVATLVSGKVPINQLVNIAPVSVLIEKVPQGSPNTIGQWVNMPSAQTELYGNANNRVAIDCTNFTQFRLIVNVLVAGAATARLGLQSSYDGVIWQGFDPVNTTLNIGTLGLKISPWVTIFSLLRTSLFLRIYGELGNGAADPQFNRIELQFR